MFLKLSSMGPSKWCNKTNLIRTALGNLGEGKPPAIPVTNGFSARRDNKTEMFPSHGVIIWMSLCSFFPVCRFQVRYGQHWAPRHPDEPTQGTLTEILLAPAERFTRLNARTSIIIDAIVFSSNIQTFDTAGSTGDTSQVSVNLNGLLYFTGALKNVNGIRVSKLAAHRGTCESI